jgi:hypothetical protein
MSRVVVVKKESMFYCILFILLLIAPLVTSYISAFSFADETITLIGAILVFNNYLDKKHTERQSVLSLFLIIIAIGLVSTIIYKVSMVPIATIYDLLLFAKPFVLFLMFFDLPQGIKNDILKILNGIAKITFLSIFVYYVVFKLFEFYLMSNMFPIMSNMAQVSWLRMVCLNIIAAANERKVTRRYIILFYISLFITGIGGFASALFASMTLFLYLYRDNKERKLKFWQIIMLVGLSFFYAYSDLLEYVFNVYAPRALLLKYGFITAVNYFPLGSGFASYGSEMAKRYYSNLYYEYGFNNVWSMAPENNLAVSKVGTLNDVYLGMIAGQFGWVGLFCYGGIIYSIYRILSRGQNNTYSKAVMISTLITILSSIMVSNNTSSHFGICMYAVLGLAVISCKTNNVNRGKSEGVNINNSTSI